MNAEQTNQNTEEITEITDDNSEFLQGLMGDDTDIDPEETDENKEIETEEPTTEEEELQEEQTNPPAEMFPYKVKALGEEKEISMADAVIAIQKGLSFDRMKERYKTSLENMQNDPRILFVDNLAQAAGMDVETFMAVSANNTDYRALLNEFGGDVNAVPKTVMDNFMTAAKVKRQNAVAQRQAQAQASYMQEKEEEAKEFLENHPEVKDVPAELASLVRAGNSLEAAYALHTIKSVQEENAQLKKDIKYYKTQRKNKASQLPSTKTKVKEETDDFTAGFLSGWKG